MSIHFDPKRFKPVAIRKGVLIAFGGTVVFAAIIYAVIHETDAFEIIFHHSRALEDWEADELILTLATFVLVFPLFLVAVLFNRVKALTRVNHELAETALALEAARVEAAKAQQVKECFLHHIHHELRTPLNAIVGFTDVIDQEMFGPIANNAYKTYLKDIRNSSVQLHRILTQVLEITAIESGGVRLKDGPIQVGTVVEAAIGDVRSRAAARNIRIDNRVNGAYPTVLVEGLRIRQALKEVLDNAVQACEDGGNVTVAVQHANGGSLVLEVTDTGIGMHPDEVKLAVLPFEQVHRQTLGRHEGGGLGLPLSIGQIKLHGGDIDIQSAPGKGTTVRIILPKERVMLGELEKV